MGFTSIIDRCKLVNIGQMIDIIMYILHAVLCYSLAKIFCLLCAANADQPAKINEITNSVVVQPSEQIVIRTVVTLSGTTIVLVFWHYGNNTYKDHIAEDPICDEAREVRLYFMHFPC